MANLQVKNLPDELNERLHRCARQENRSIRDFVLEAVRRELDRHAFSSQLRQRPTTKLQTRAADLLEMERRERGVEP